MPIQSDYDTAVDRVCRAVRAETLRAMNIHEPSPGTAEVREGARMDSPTYPKRPMFFAHRFCRLLTRAAVAQQIGPEACWLLAVIAHQEDAIHYARPVTYYNEQLMPLCGFGSRKRLVEARRKAIDGGWLFYRGGGKGTPGTYWALIPEAYQETPDGPLNSAREAYAAILEKLDEFKGEV